MPSSRPSSELAAAAVARLDDPSAPIAETARRVCAEAERLGLTRPGYERIRVLVHAARGGRLPPADGIRPP